ncbi:MAG: aspartyl protease family protein [Candidatus Rokubacteria bacterium]|nr:aspartyl protease family protein [Candidatus Rokubacteria bacterium]
MRYRAALILTLSLLLPQPSLAQLYRWTDEQGTVHYTADPDRIPEAYRAGVRVLPVPAAPAAPPAPEPSAPSAGVARISFTPGFPILVSARINGTGPVTLILDTGSDRTVVSPAALGGLGIPIGSGTRAGIKGVTGSAQAEVVWVSSIEVGEARVGSLAIIAHDAELRHAHGLLGRDFLAHFTVTIDPKEGVVTLAPR